MVITVEVAVMETQEDIPADMEVIRVVLWQEVLRLETPVPFKVMTLVGLLGLGLLAGGVMIYRKTTSGKKNFKGTGRK